MAHQPDPVVARESRDPKQIHPTGQFVALCVDCIDLGDRVETYDKKEPKLSPKLAIVFRTAKRDGEGNHIDLPREFTNALGDKANLRHFLEDWRGKPYTPEKIKKGIALHKMVGQWALIQVTHKQSRNGNTYAEVKTVMGVPEEMLANPFPTLSEYTRAKWWSDRKAEYAKEAREHRARMAPMSEADDDIGAGEQEDKDDLPF